MYKQGKSLDVWAAQCLSGGSHTGQLQEDV